jgi:ABC-type polysaccharide/polyol phosphate export permease
MENTMPTCPNCSNPIDKGTKYCPYCDVDVNIKFTATVDSSGAVVAASNQVTTLVKRYKDAYLVARVTDGFGSFIKGIGLIAAGLFILIGLLTIVSGRDSSVFAAGIVIAIFGVFVGILFYLLGVLVSAQGQILKASLDGAVNSSPFLSNDHKANIMSLPAA